LQQLSLTPCQALGERVSDISGRAIGSWISADDWSDDVRLSDLEEKFTCTACGKRGADVRPDFDWNIAPAARCG
jgi:hypothetical protein